MLVSGLETMYWGLQNLMPIQIPFSDKSPQIHDKLIAVLLSLWGNDSVPQQIRMTPLAVPVQIANFLDK